MILHNRFAIMKSRNVRSLLFLILSCILDFHNVQLLKVPSDEALLITLHPRHTTYKFTIRDETEQMLDHDGAYEI